MHLCIALGTRAQVLLLDEPLASLDPLARREFLNVLAEAIRSDDVTALLSSHVITDVQQACDRLVVLGVGQLLFDGPIAEALAQHQVGPGSDIGGVRAETEVATFAEADGSLSTLHRVNGAPPDGVRPATLEEVVLGYLVAGRTRRRDAEAAGCALLDCSSRRTASKRFRS